MDEIESLRRRAAALGAAGALARQAGEESVAEQNFRNGLVLALAALDRLDGASPGDVRLEILHEAIHLALEGGEAGEVRRLIAIAERAENFLIKGDWEQIRDVATWSDAWLVAAVRRDPPDAAALDVLVERYWKTLFGRCQILAGNYHKASDLAQEAWCRVLRVRHALKPGGNFPAYLTTIATNLWRDLCRAARRAGPMAESQMASLDASFSDDEGRNSPLADILPDLNGLQAEEQKLLMLDIDQALERLTPQLRDVLVSRFLTGESCAEIGRRYGRTEQTVSAWVRQAVQEMKLHLAESNGSALRKLPHE